MLFKFTFNFRIPGTVQQQVFEKTAEIAEGLEQCGVLHLVDALPMDLLAEVIFFFL